MTESDDGGNTVSKIQLTANAWSLLSAGSLLPDGSRDPIRDALAREINLVFNAAVGQIDDIDRAYASIEARLIELDEDPRFHEYDCYATDVREIVWGELKRRYNARPDVALSRSDEDLVQEVVQEHWIKIAAKISAEHRKTVHADFATAVEDIAKRLSRKAAARS